MLEPRVTMRQEQREWERRKNISVAKIVSLLFEDLREGKPANTISILSNGSLALRALGTQIFKA